MKEKMNQRRCEQRQEQAKRRRSLEGRGVRNAKDRYDGNTRECKEKEKCKCG